MEIICVCQVHVGQIVSVTVLQGGRKSRPQTYCRTAGGGRGGRVGGRRVILEHKGTIQ